MARIMVVHDEMVMEPVLVSDVLAFVTGEYALKKFRMDATRS